MFQIFYLLFYTVQLTGTTSFSIFLTNFCYIGAVVGGFLGYLGASKDRSMMPCVFVVLFVLFWEFSIMASQQSTFSLTLFMDIYLSWQLQELLFAGMFWRKGILPKVSLGLTLLQVIYWIMAVVAYGVVVWEGITIKEYQEIIILNVVITSIAWTWGLILWIHLFTKPDRYLTREKTPFTPKSEN